MSEDFDLELKLGFLDEALQCVDDVEQCFLSLETNPDDAENINRIFRLAHNLKGSSKAVGFDQMGALTHEFETFILKIKNNELKPTPPVVNLLLRCNDFIRKMITGLKENLKAQFEIEPLMGELKSPMSEAVESEKVKEVEEPAAVEEVTPIEEEIAAIPVQAPISLPTAPALAKAPPASPANSSKAAPEESIRISVSKVESLLNFIGEMVILQSVLKEQAISTQSLTLKRTLHQLEKVTKEIQDISMGLRMVPVKPTFQKMQRIVRDTALALGKDVNIQLVGEETEVDKNVLEKMNDPLVHLIRNSVDHGIESTADRLASGKPAQGQVKLSAFHKSGKLIIEVSDDGAGLNPTKLLKIAIAKGVVKPDAQLSDKEIFNLIFAPGFSTKEAVTDVSGRGVGMDVVKTNILDLSGEISIQSTLGKGTSFHISLPLTLAIIDGMILTYGNERFVLPLSHVFETLRPQAQDIQNNTGLGSVLMLRGENMPIFRLGDFFGRKSPQNNHEMIAIVVRTGPQPFALLVDDILGQSQVVVKQLSSDLSGFKGVSGCTILGDGKPALILEPLDLIKRKLSVSPQLSPHEGKAI